MQESTTGVITLDGGMESLKEYSIRMRREAIDAYIEREIWEPRKTALLILNDTTKEIVCLSQQQARILLSEMQMTARLLDDSYKRAQALFNRAEILKDDVVPKIEGILETMSGRDWIESEY